MRFQIWYEWHVQIQFLSSFFSAGAKYLSFCAKISSISVDLNVLQYCGV
jgi:hypothetical protein